MASEHTAERRAKPRGESRAEPRAEPRDGAEGASLLSYAAGFALSIVLTAIPFSLAMGYRLARAALVVSIIAFAVAQILVHLVFFLHLNSSGKWNRVALAYVALLLLILVGGSVWIMYHLNYNMMAR